MDIFKKQYTVWKLDGRRVPSQTPGAVGESRESAKYYGTVGGRHVSLSADKQAAVKVLRKPLADAELRAFGLADPHATDKAAPLAGHLDAFELHLRAKGDGAVHSGLTLERIRASAGCGGPR